MKTCGGCEFWMRKSCPHEKNVRGFSRGPSVNASVCGKYEESAQETRDKYTRLLAKLNRIIDREKQRIADAETFSYFRRFF